MTGLRLTGLTATQGGFVLGPVDLTVGRGEAVAVIGPSGSGKTTLLRSIAGFVPGGRGTIAIRGEDRSSAPPERRGIGYVPQGLGLFPHRSVAGNVAFPLEVRDRPDRARRLAELLEEWGLSARARDPPDRLSGGERQRVAMARAMAADPELLLWDEPMAALDPVARSALLDTLAAAVDRTGPPLLLVTHDPETALTIADQILVLHHGRPTYLGPAEGLGARPVDPYTARFTGYENIFPAAGVPLLRELTGARSAPAGATGGCLRAVALGPAPSGAATGVPVRVLRRRRDADGWRFRLRTAEGTDLWMRRSDGPGRVPARGDELRVLADPDGVHWFGPEGGP